MEDRSNDMPFRESRLTTSRLLREFARDTSPDELIWHRDREDRAVRVLEGRGWSLQFDGGLPRTVRLGETYHIPAGTWHRLLRSPEATTLRLVVELKKGDRVKSAGQPATVKVPNARGDLVGIDPAGPDDMEMVPEDELEPLREKDKGGMPGNPNYYVGKKTKRTKSNKEMAREIDKCKKEPRPKSCYDEWTADKTYKEKRNEAVADAELDYLLEAVLSEEDLTEGELSKKTRETLKKKAEKANMPLSALTAVYRKGLAAWLTGHRQGVPQHAWAMARTNSFIRGGKARSVDKAEWKKVQKHRKKK